MRFLFLYDGFDDGHALDFGVKELLYAFGHDGDILGGSVIGVAIVEHEIEIGEYFLCRFVLNETSKQSVQIKSVPFAAPTSA